MMLTVIAPALRSAKPRNSRKPSRPKITPLAPMTTVFGVRTSHAPRPLLSMVIRIDGDETCRVTASVRDHAEHREDDRVREQVPEARVQERRERDAVEAGETSRGWMP